jgi:hypothetical protein
MELLKQINHNRPRYVSTSMIGNLDRRILTLSKFQGLQSQPEGKSSKVTQLTEKRYQELTWVFSVAI